MTEVISLAERVAAQKQEEEEHIKVLDTTIVTFVEEALKEEGTCVLCLAFNKNPKEGSDTMSMAGRLPEDPGDLALLAYYVKIYFESALQDAILHG